MPNLNSFSLLVNNESMQSFKIHKMLVFPSLHLRLKFCLLNGVPICSLKNEKTEGHFRSRNQRETEIDLRPSISFLEFYS